MLAEEFEVSARLGCVHARRWGSSTAPLLLIGVPGLSGTSERFAFLGDRIGCDQVQLVALDPRGRGRSETTAAGSYGWENHSRDVLAVADTLGFGRFAMVGQSMGGSVAMKTAELDGGRLQAVVLIDVAGRVDRGVGTVIASEIGRLDHAYSSVDEYLDVVRADGRIEPWNDYWDRAYRAEVIEIDGRVVHRASAAAVTEDRAYTATQDPYGRWKHLTMPTLLLRATRELETGCGFIVPEDDRDRFARDVPSATVVEVDANHLTIVTHDDMAGAIAGFVAAITI